jgi:outer membrane lipoprotein SlyB
LHLFCDGFHEPPSLLCAAEAAQPFNGGWKEKPMKNFVVAGLLAITATAALADNKNGMPPGIAKKMQGKECHDCGTVQDVRKHTQKGEGGAVGIVGGAVAGGLIGNQFGKGDGKKLATVGGAVAGGFVGNEVQKKVTSKDVWVTTIKMRDGSTRTFQHDHVPGWKSGQVVRVKGTTVTIVAGT